MESIQKQLAAQGLREATTEAGWYVMVTDPKTGEATKVWATDLPAFEAQEIAYRLPNRKKGYAMGEWKRTVARTQAAFDKKIADLRERDAEIETRKYEGS